METRTCLCGAKFKTWPCRSKRFCLISCTQYKRHLSKVRSANNPGGFKASVKKHSLSEKAYNTLHRWVSRNFGKPSKCERCCKTGLKGKYINWANKTGIYNRLRKNWVRLCRKCHYAYDHKKL